MLDLTEANWDEMLDKPELDLGDRCCITMALQSPEASSEDRSEAEFVIDHRRRHHGEIWNV